MLIDNCAEKVRELQSYVGKTTLNGLTVLEVIIGPVDDSKIKDFVNVHFYPNDSAIIKAVSSVKRFEPWVLCAGKPDGLPQKFKEAFPL